MKFHHNLRDAINTAAFYILNFTRIFSFSQTVENFKYFILFPFSVVRVPNLFSIKLTRLVHSRFTPKANFIRIVYISLSVMFQRPLFSSTDVTLSIAIPTFCFNVLCLLQPYEEVTNFVKSVLIKLPYLATHRNENFISNTILPLLV